MGRREKKHQPRSTYNSFFIKSDARSRRAGMSSFSGGREQNGKISVAGKENCKIDFHGNDEEAWDESKWHFVVNQQICERFG